MTDKHINMRGENEGNLRFAGLEVHLHNLQLPFLQNKRTFVTSCLLQWMPKPFASGVFFRGKYSRTSVARTLMARLPRLFRTRPWVPWKNPIAADEQSFRVIFFFMLKMVYCVYSLESPR